MAVVRFEILGLAMVRVVEETVSAGGTWKEGAWRGDCCRCRGVLFRGGCQRWWLLRENFWHREC